MNMLMNPWSLLDDLFDENSRVYRSMQARATGRFPPVNVYLDDHAVIMDVELPGATAQDVTLTLEAQAVTLADRPHEEEKTKASEMDTPATGTRTPRWSRRIELPFRVDEEKANAKFTNGILRIELPKADQVGVRHIAIAD